MVSLLLGIADPVIEPSDALGLIKTLFQMFGTPGVIAYLAWYIFRRLFDAEKGIITAVSMRHMEFLDRTSEAQNRQSDTLASLAHGQSEISAAQLDISKNIASLMDVQCKRTMLVEEELQRLLATTKAHKVR
jgi:hypothetical protein